MSEEKLPAAFLSRMRGQLGSEEAYFAFLRSYDKPALHGLRVNTLKISKEKFEKLSPFSLRPVPWEENGFYVAEEKIGRHPYHFAGLYYSQEPSAMSVVPLLKIKRGERVLDMCAAPGGKSTQLAQALAGTGILVANEINGKRARILSQNIERLGVKNAVVTNCAPSFLAERFPAYFDKILVDAPCSGEGMFKKNEREAIENWSEENVAICAARQSDILDAAATALCAGGRLVYSTCTFSSAEDEIQTEQFLFRHPEFCLLQQKKLYPHETEGEGHYYAVFEKTDGEKRSEILRQSSNVSKKERELFSALCKEVLKTEPQGVLYRGGDALYILPNDIFCIEKLPILRAGVRAGEYVKNGKSLHDRMEPSHALAMSMRLEETVRSTSLTTEEAEKYLRGETFERDGENGWTLVCVDGYPIGWGKAADGRLKNHYPKGLRLIK